MIIYSKSKILEVLTLQFYLSIIVVFTYHDLRKYFRILKTKEQNSIIPLHTIIFPGVHVSYLIRKFSPKFPFSGTLWYKS